MKVFSVVLLTITLSCPCNSEDRIQRTSAKTLTRKLCKCVVKSNACGINYKTYKDDANTSKKCKHFVMRARKEENLSRANFSLICPTVNIACPTIPQKMCQCASKHDVCGEKCPALFDIEDPECNDYAANGICGGEFPTDKTYAEHCPTIGAACPTIPQKMCKCASKHDVCGEKCPALFDIEDPECNDYAANGICGGEFPTDKTYAEHCPTIGAACLTIPQKMCKCAKKHRVCGEKCPALFDIEDPECNDYAANGICGGEFPMDKTYAEHCPSIGGVCAPQ